MDDSVQVQCPYCFEWVELYVDPEQRGEMVQDCDVCCRPWRVHVGRRGDGSPPWSSTAPSEWGRHPATNSSAKRPKPG